MLDHETISPIFKVVFLPTLNTCKCPKRPTKLRHSENESEHSKSIHNNLVSLPPKSQKLCWNLHYVGMSSCNDLSGPARRYDPSAHCPQWTSFQKHTCPFLVFTFYECITSTCEWPSNSVFKHNSPYHNSSDFFATRTLAVRKHFLWDILG